MTLNSLNAALIVGAAIAFTVGFLLRKMKNPSAASSIAIGISSWAALPILLGNWQEISRLLIPREAIEWIPISLLGLAIISAGVAFDLKRRTWWLVLGCVLCIAVAVRVMFGSYYLRSTDLRATNIGAILAWGASLAWLWWARCARLPEAAFKLDGVVQILGLLSVGACLGMSGSMTQGATGVLFAVIATVAWISSSRPSELISVSALLLLGLGPTFSEMSWTVAALLAATILLSSLSTRLASTKLQMATLALATATMMAGTTITANKFIQTVSGKSEGASGYEAYR